MLLEPTRVLSPVKRFFCPQNFDTRTNGKKRINFYLPTRANVINKF